MGKNKKEEGTLTKENETKIPTCSNFRYFYSCMQLKCFLFIFFLLLLKFLTFSIFPFSSILLLLWNSRKWFHFQHSYWVSWVILSQASYLIPHSVPKYLCIRIIFLLSGSQSRIIIVIICLRFLLSNFVRYFYLPSRTMSHSDNCRKRRVCSFNIALNFAYLRKHAQRTIYIPCLNLWVNIRKRRAHHKIDFYI